MPVVILYNAYYAYISNFCNPVKTCNINQYAVMDQLTSTNKCYLDANRKKIILFPFGRPFNKKPLGTRETMVSSRIYDEYITLYLNW